MNVLLTGDGPVTCKVGFMVAPVGNPETLRVIGVSGFPVAGFISGSVPVTVNETCVPGATESD